MSQKVLLISKLIQQHPTIKIKEIYIHIIQDKVMLHSIQNYINFNKLDTNIIHLYINIIHLYINIINL